MARPNGHCRSSTISATKFGVSIFVTTTVIILSQHLSFAQQCEVTCSQTSVIRDRPYDELIEIAQNRQWEDEEDFGSGDNGDLFDVIRRYKLKSRNDEGDLVEKLRRKRSPIIYETTSSVPSYFNTSIDVNTAATTLLVSALFGLGYYLVIEKPNIVGVAPPDQPQPGTLLGGGIPLGRSEFVKEARGLFRSLDLGSGLYPVAVFPPYADNELKLPGGYRSTALIFEEKKCPNNRKRRGLGEFKKSVKQGYWKLPWNNAAVKEFKDNFVYGVNRIGSVFAQIDRYLFHSGPEKLKKSRQKNS